MNFNSLLLADFASMHSIAMGKRRHNVVRPNAYLEECITKVQDFERTVDSNFTLVHWVKLQVLADDLAAQILPDELASISEAKVRSAYKNFEKQLKDWEEVKNEHLHPRKCFPGFLKHLTAGEDIR